MKYFRVTVFKRKPFSKDDSFETLGFTITKLNEIENFTNIPSSGAIFNKATGVTLSNYGSSSSPVPYFAVNYIDENGTSHAQSFTESDCGFLYTVYSEDDVASVGSTNNAANEEPGVEPSAEPVEEPGEEPGEEPEENNTEEQGV